MKVGFDLDGTLDKAHLAELARFLLDAGVEVHVITGIFDEAGDWQSEDAKWRKLGRIGLVQYVKTSPPAIIKDPRLHVHFLHAVSEQHSRDYRLADLGLRKGALCEELGITIFFDDSEKYMEMMPKMTGDTTLLHVR